MEEKAMNPEEEFEAEIAEGLDYPEGYCSLYSYNLDKLFGRYCGNSAKGNIGINKNFHFVYFASLSSKTSFVRRILPSLSLGSGISAFTECASLFIGNQRHGVIR